MALDPTLVGRFGAAGRHQHHRVEVLEGTPRRLLRCRDSRPLISRYGSTQATSGMLSDRSLIVRLESRKTSQKTNPNSSKTGLQSRPSLERLDRRAVTAGAAEATVESFDEQEVEVECALGEPDGLHPVPRRLRDRALDIGRVVDPVRSNLDDTVAFAHVVLVTADVPGILRALSARRDRRPPGHCNPHCSGQCRCDPALPHREPPFAQRAHDPRWSHINSTHPAWRHHRRPP